MKIKFPERNTTRIVTRFLFLPMTLPVNHSFSVETRWLEFIKIQQKYRVITYQPFLNYWENISFIEE